MEDDVPDFKWVIFVGCILICRVVYVIDIKKIRVAKDAVPFPEGERISGFYHRF